MKSKTKAMVFGLVSTASIVAALCVFNNNRGFSTLTNAEDDLPTNTITLNSSNLTILEINGSRRYFSLNKASALLDGGDFATDTCFVDADGGLEKSSLGENGHIFELDGRDGKNIRYRIEFNFDVDITSIDEIMVRGLFDNGSDQRSGMRYTGNTTAIDVSSMEYVYVDSIEITYTCLK